MADEIVGGLRAIAQELKTVQDQMADLDNTSQEFVKLSQKAGELRNKMKDVSEAVNSQTGPAISNFGNNISTARGQLMELDLEGFGNSMKSAAANIGNINLKSIKEGLSGMASGFASIGKALLTNPIFLIGAAIALIAMNMDKVFKLFPSFERALKGIGDEERAIARAVEARAEASKKAYDQSSLEVNQMKLAGKTEREILDYRMARLKTSIADAKVNLDTAVIQAKMQIETAKRNRDILDGIIKFITLPLKPILAAVDAIGKIAGQNFGIAEKFQDLLGDMAIDPEQTEADLNKSIAAQQDAIKQMESDYAGFNLQLREIDKKGADEKAKIASDAKAKQKSEDDKAQAEKDKKAAEDLEKARKDEELLRQMKREALEEEQALSQEIQNVKQGALATEIQNVRDAYFEKIEAAKKYNLDYTALEEERDKKIREIEAATKERKEKEDKEKADQDKANQEKQIQDANDLENAKLQIAQQYMNAAQSLTDAMATSGLMSAKKAFEVGKALSIAQTTISTIQGVQNALNAQSVVPDPLGTALKIANAVAIGAAGAASIAKIGSTQFEGGKSGGTGSVVPAIKPSSNTPSGQAPAALNLSSLQGNNSVAPLQTYVVAGQVSNAQQAEFKIKNTASILGGG